MSETTAIPVEDIHPRPNARPLDQKLVSSITESMTLVGFLPSKAIDVRRDGDIYWIVDGGHRVAAAKAAGIERVPAMVDDLDEAGVLTMEGAANLQRPDTEDERWARAQEFFALGDAAKPEQIAVATGLDLEAQRKAFRVIRKLADPVAAEDLTLEQALAADAFLDDDEAFTAIMNAGQSWNAVASTLTRQRKLAASVEEKRAIIKAAKVKLLEEDFPTGKSYLGRGDEKPKGAKYARIAKYEYSGTAEIQWYADAKATADPEDEVRREAAAKREAELEQAQAARLAFLHGILTAAMVDAAIAHFAEKAWGEGWNADADNIEKALEGVQGFVPRVYAAVLSRIEDNLDYLLSHPAYDYYVGQYGADCLAYFEALKAAGYDASPAETEALATIADALKGEDSAEGDGE